MTRDVDGTTGTGSVSELPPVRGLVLLSNRRGRPYALRDVHRWISVNRLLFRVGKIDLLDRTPDAHALKDLVTFSRCGSTTCLRACLRTDCSSPPPDQIGAAGVTDVFLTPPHAPAAHFDAWLQACADAALPVRVQLRGPFEQGLDAAALAEKFARAGVTSVNVTAWDPLDGLEPQDAADLEKINALALAVAGCGIECHIYGVPLCFLSKENLPRAGNQRAFFMDHQQYDRGAYNLAVKLAGRSPRTVALVLALLLAGRTSIENPLDQWLLEWLLVKHPWWYSLATLFHKVTLFSRALTAPAKDTADPGAVPPRTPRPGAATGRVCGRCSLRHVCDGHTARARRAFPGVALRRREGDVVVSTRQLGPPGPIHFDEVDRERIDADSYREALAEEARRIKASRPPRVLPAIGYRAANTYGAPLSDAVRWHSITHAEKRSTVLTRFHPSDVIEFDVGGGLADFVGFGIGKRLCLVCPMVLPSHTITLYLQKSGRCVLLRDGLPVPPAQLEGGYFGPAILPDRNEICLSLWNVDGTVSTQEIRFWPAEGETSRPPARYSVVIFSTRFSRRLQATLQSLAHQEGISPGDVEVVVGYVPGLDATDDLIESMRLLYPGLRITRSPFGEDRAKSKGFVINESLGQATGEWIILMDADILLPPDFFQRIEKERENCVFMAPDGRVMLDAQTTAKVLLGEIEPWREWRALVSGGEYRHREAEGIPIGFCQIVRNTCFETVQYEEYEHFAVADSNFGLAMRREFGREKRLDGMPVIHLDHGGSRWFGTRGHL